MVNYLWTIVIAFDQLLGSFIPNAYASETISARAYREDWKIQAVIDLFLGYKHCETRYWLEVNLRQNFPKPINKEV